jgi:hypothetical protein
MSTDWIVAFHQGHLLQVREDGTADLIVGSHTNVTVELAEPVTFVRPLGKPARPISCGSTRTTSAPQSPH